jgi:multiple sugar transport system permease protein
VRGAATARGLAWISPWVIGFVAFVAAPALVSLACSLTDYSLLEPPLFIGLENYRELWGDSLFWLTLRNTIVYTAGSVTLTTIIAIGLALLLQRDGRGVALARAAVFLPTLVPLVAAALGWMWLYNGELGLLNALLERVGITGPNWLGDRSWAMPSLVAMSGWQIGTAMVIYIAALRDVPRALYDAAAIDGASTWRRLRHVTLPMISPAILFNVVIAIIWSLQVFAVPHIMTEGGPDNATNFYTMYLYANAFEYQRMGYASAMAWIQLLVIVAMTGATFLLARRLVFYRAG